MNKLGGWETIAFLSKDYGKNLAKSKGAEPYKKYYSKIECAVNRNMRDESRQR